MKYININQNYTLHIISAQRVNGTCYRGFAVSRSEIQTEYGNDPRGIVAPTDLIVFGQVFITAFQMIVQIYFYWSQSLVGPPCRSFDTIQLQIPSSKRSRAWENLALGNIPWLRSVDLICFTSLLGQLLKSGKSNHKNSPVQPLGLHQIKLAHE